MTPGWIRRSRANSPRSERFPPEVVRWLGRLANGGLPVSARGIDAADRPGRAIRVSRLDKPRSAQRRALRGRAAYLYWRASEEERAHFRILELLRQKQTAKPMMRQFRHSETLPEGLAEVLPHTMRHKLERMESEELRRRLLLRTDLGRLVPELRERARRE